jgi:hypothetical protein
MSAPEVEKGGYEYPATNEKGVVANDHHKFESGEERRQSIAGDEAAAVYGNTGAAEEFGYVERG